MSSLFSLEHTPAKLYLCQGRGVRRTRMNLIRECSLAAAVRDIFVVLSSIRYSSPPVACISRQDKMSEGKRGGDTVYFHPFFLIKHTFLWKTLDSDQLLQHLVFNFHYRA